MHRPTFHPAIAKSVAGGLPSMQQSVKDQAGHTQLKYRKHGQNTSDEMKYANLKMELQRREAAILDEKKQAIAMVVREENTVKETPLLLTSGGEVDVAKFDDEDADFGSDSDAFSDSDDDDEEEELLRELEKIKAERQEALERKEEEDRILQEEAHKAEAIKGNPLVNISGDNAKVKRKWNDDVVFRNQAANEPETKKRFVNDTIRNDFHRSFLKKYIH